MRCEYKFVAWRRDHRGIDCGEAAAADVGHYVSATCRRNDLVERVALFCVLEHQNGR